jgi:hypothetical protein
LTVTTSDGSDTTVLTDSSTTVTRSVAASVSDIKVGDQITVTGAVTGSTVAADRVADLGDQSANGGPNGSGRTPTTDANGNPVGRTRPTDQSGNTIPRGQNGQNGQNGGGNGQNGNGAGFTAGQVTAVSGPTITITGRNGTTYTVTTTPSTTLTRTVSGTVADLKVGDTVTAVGTTEPNGTVSATRVTEGAGGNGGFGGGGPGGRQGATTTTN